MKKLRYTPVHERVLQRTKIPLDKNECWLWYGPLNNAGYGMIKGDSSEGDPKMVTVHRVMGRYKGLNIKYREIQHTCLVKNCVNPDHLVEGNSKTRHKRIVEKHGRHFQKPKKPYITCKVCKKKTHVVWFNRKHKECLEFSCTEV